MYDAFKDCLARATTDLYQIFLQREPEFRPPISEIVQELLQMI